VLAINGPSHNGSQVEEIDSPRNPALGLLDRFEFASSRCGLNGCQSLLFHTDGLTEQADATGHEFGEDGLRAALAKSARPEPTAIIDAIHAGLKSHAERSHFSDDVCVLAVGLNARQP